MYQVYQVPLNSASYSVKLHHLYLFLFRAYIFLLSITIDHVLINTPGLPVMNTEQILSIGTRTLSTDHTCLKI